ncbi:MAG: hypothetical protein AAB967_00585, partial [Patescibacteria group bacterium]
TFEGLSTNCALSASTIPAISSSLLPAAWSRRTSVSDIAQLALGTSRAKTTIRTLFTVLIFNPPYCVASRFRN